MVTNETNTPIKVIMLDVFWVTNTEGHLTAYGIGKLNQDEAIRFLIPDIKIHINNHLRIGTEFLVSDGVGTMVLTTGTGDFVDFPEECPECKTLIIDEGEHKRCPNLQCPSQGLVKTRELIGKFGLGITSIDEKVMVTLLENDLLTYPDQLFGAIDEDVLEKLNIANKENILEEIENAKTNPLSSWLRALAIPRLTYGRCQEIGEFHNQYKFKNVEHFMKFLTSANKMVEFFGTDGILIANHIAIDELNISSFLSYYQFSDLKEESMGVLIKYSGQHYFDFPELRTIFSDYGYLLDESLCKSTRYLLAGADAKLKDIEYAKRIGVDIIYVDDLDIDDMIIRMRY